MTSRGAEKMKHDIIGVDVRKTISTPTGWPTAPSGVSPMTGGGNKALIKWLAETPLNRVVFEPVFFHGIRTPLRG
jgi:hypothetical protein